MRIPAAAIVVASLTLAYVGFGTFVGGGYDPGRDVAEAWAIAHDGARPLLGPLVAGQVRFGPAWFYLLALPLALWQTWFAAAMTAVGVGALQFPLAYWAGKRLADARLGLLFAIALALPGWASFEAVGFASTNVVRTLVLATLCATLRARDTPHVGWWLAAGLGAAAAMHAHPSCAWLVPVVVACAWQRPGVVGDHLRERAAALIAVAIGVALPFAPAAFAPPSMVDASRAVAAGNASLAQLARIPALMWSIAWTGPHAIMDAVYPRGSAWAANAATVAALAAILGALRGIAAAAVGDRAARWGAALTLVAVAFVACIRPVTPVYMAYSIVPAYALLVASGWRLLLRARPSAVPLAVGVALVAALVVGIGVVRSMRDGGGRIEPVLADITRTASPTAVATDIWLPAVAVDPLGRAICAAPAPAYGALGYLLDVFYSMPLRLHCAGSLSRVTDESPAIGGRVGLAMRRYRDLASAPSARIGGIGLDPVARVVAAPPRRDLPQDAAYPPHPYLSGTPTRVEYDFDAPAAEAVVVANPRVTWMAEWTSEVRCDGANLPPATGDLVTRVYRCPGNAYHRWHVALAAADPRAIEIVTFVPHPRMAAAQDARQSHIVASANGDPSR